MGCGSSRPEYDQNANARPAVGAVPTQQYSAQAPLPQQYGAPNMQQPGPGPVPIQYAQQQQPQQQGFFKKPTKASKVASAGNLLGVLAG